RPRGSWTLVHLHLLHYADVLAVSREGNLNHRQTAALRGALRIVDSTSRHVASDDGARKARQLRSAVVGSDRRSDRMIRVARQCVHPGGLVAEIGHRARDQKDVVARAGCERDRGKQRNLILIGTHWAREDDPLIDRRDLTRARIVAAGIAHDEKQVPAIEGLHALEGPQQIELAVPRRTEIELLRRNSTRSGPAVSRYIDRLYQLDRDHRAVAHEAK